MFRILEVRQALSANETPPPMREVFFPRRSTSPCTEGLQQATSRAQPLGPCSSHCPTVPIFHKLITRRLLSRSVPSTIWTSRFLFIGMSNIGARVQNQRFSLVFAIYKQLVFGAWRTKLEK